jgi:hypothetical protein
MDCLKNVFPPLEPKFLMWKELVKRLNMFVKCCALCLAQKVLVLECAAHHGMALEHFSAHLYLYIGQENTVQR